MKSSVYYTKKIMLVKHVTSCYVSDEYTRVYNPKPYRYIVPNVQAWFWAMGTVYAY